MSLPEFKEQRIDQLKPINEINSDTIFINGPAEYLVKKVASEIRKVPEFAAVFGVTEYDENGFIDAYERQDYPIRALPALRIYNEIYVKQFDSWYVEGDLILDVILPAELRREDLQQIQDTITSALMQQFRRLENFFVKVENQVPGLNELGKTFSVDKSKGFVWGENIVPLTQIKANFRIDLKIWDKYLEENDRTKEDPFNKTLAALKRIVTTIEAIRDDNETELELGVDQNIES